MEEVNSYGKTLDIEVVKTAFRVWKKQADTNHSQCIIFKNGGYEYWVNAGCYSPLYPSFDRAWVRLPPVKKDSALWEWAKAIMNCPLYKGTFLGNWEDVFDFGVEINPNQCMKLGFAALTSLRTPWEHQWVAKNFEVLMSKLPLYEAIWVSSVFMFRCYEQPIFMIPNGFFHGRFIHFGVYPPFENDGAKQPSEMGHIMGCNSSPRNSLLFHKDTPMPKGSRYNCSPTLCTGDLSTLRKALFKGGELQTLKHPEKSVRITF